MLHSLFFISNVANCQLVSGFQLYTVVACVGCLASKKDTSPVAYITFKNQIYELKFFSGRPF